jgi:hypothetical protein
MTIHVIQTAESEKDKLDSLYEQEQVIDKLLTVFKAARAGYEVRFQPEAMPLK